MLNRPMLSLVSRPTVNVRPLVSERACRLGSNPSSAAAARTRRRVSGRSWPVSFMALETVPRDTPARFATSSTVGWARTAVFRAVEGVVVTAGRSSAGNACHLMSPGLPGERLTGPPGEGNTAAETDFLTGTPGAVPDTRTALALWGSCSPMAARGG